MGIYSYLSRLTRGAARDRHDTRGGMRWTRQRQAPDERRLGVPHHDMACQGRVRGTYGAAHSDSADDDAVRLRTGAEMHPIRIAFARRPKSCGPDARRWRQGTERLSANRPAGNNRFRP